MHHQCPPYYLKRIWFAVYGFVFGVIQLVIFGIVQLVVILVGFFCIMAVILHIDLRLLWWLCVLPGFDLVKNASHVAECGFCFLGGGRLNSGCVVDRFSCFTKPLCDEAISNAGQACTICLATDHTYLSFFPVIRGGAYDDAVFDLPLSRQRRVS